MALAISRAMRSVVAESAVVKDEVVAPPPLPSSRLVAAIVVADSILYIRSINKCMFGLDALGMNLIVEQIM